MNALAKIVLGIAGAALILAPGTGAAKDVSFGEKEFNSNCAICHGAGGKGDGYWKEMLTVAPANLTVLSKNNGGVFPADKVYAVIDGRDAVKAHGRRDMPIWGDNYNTEAMATYTHMYGVGYDPEAFVRGRILALISYLDSLQKK